MKKYILKNISTGVIAVCKGVLNIPEGFELYKESSDLYPIPDDKRFRDSWRIKNGQVKVDLPLARLAKKAELLTIKDEKMAVNATEFNLKLSLGQDTSAISSKQQLLNDLEASIISDLAKKKSVNTIDSYDPFELYSL